MCWNLYYLKIVDDEKVMKFERNFEKGELALIEECNQILGNFNSFCDYYTMLINSLKELKDYIKKIETSEYRITSPFEKKHTIVETNIRVVDFIGMFKNYLDYYEVQVKHVYGEKSDELKDFKRKCSSFFDKYFEYIFLYNLRHYSVHYRLPVTKVISKFEDKKRTFYIEKDKLKEWSGWKATIKKDINNLEEDIELSQFIKKIETIISELNHELSYYNTPEVLGAIKIMKKYVRPRETPYIVKVMKSKNNNPNFETKSMIDDYFLATNNILKLGITSCEVFSKEYGFQFFDPFNLIFTKEEKEKFGFE